MICCEVCNKASDECAVTGTPINWSEFGITVMEDCPEREESDYSNEFERLSDHSEDHSNND